MRLIAITLAVVAVLGYAGAKFYLYSKTKKGMEDAVLQLSPIMDLRYGGISSTFTGELTIDDVRITIKGFEDEIKIDSLGIDTPSMLAIFELGKLARRDPSDPGELPEYFGVFAEGLHVESESDYYGRLYREVKKAVNRDDFDEPGAQCIGKYGLFSPRALSAMGYETQVLNYAITLRQTESEFVIDMDFESAEMFGMKLSMAIDGDMRKELSKGQRFRPRLKNLRVENTDRSIIGRTKKYCAKLGLTPEQTLASYMDALDYFGKKNRIALDKQLVDPYCEYINGKPTLLVTAQPRQPINFKEITMYNPKDVPAVLNLEAQAY